VEQQQKIPRRRWRVLTGHVVLHVVRVRRLRGEMRRTVARSHRPGAFVETRALVSGRGGFVMLIADRDWKAHLYYNYH
jgi:hypothetical protein